SFGYPNLLILQSANSSALRIMSRSQQTRKHALPDCTTTGSAILGSGSKYWTSSSITLSAIPELVILKIGYKLLYYHHFGVAVVLLSSARFHAFRTSSFSVALLGHAVSAPCNCCIRTERTRIFLSLVTHFLPFLASTNPIVRFRNFGSRRIWLSRSETTPNF